jgi:hypothetical protein
MNRKNCTQRRPNAGLRPVFVFSYIPAFALIYLFVEFFDLVDVNLQMFFTPQISRSAHLLAKML